MRSFLLHAKRAMAAAILLFAAGGAANAAALYAYQTGTSNPWGNTTNNAAMNAAFGAGNWDFYQGFNATAFSGGTRFVFLDGGDSNANQLNTFLSSNIGTIEAFVASGGSVFINAAPNVGGSFGLGFGGVTLNYTSFPFELSHSGTATVTAAGVAAGLTAGGITTNYTGNFFSHATISGPITALITGSAGTILGGLDWGAGYALFGGQTTTNFHSPSSDAFQLRVNELLFAANQAKPVPEPASLALLGMALIGFGATRMRRRARA